MDTVIRLAYPADHTGPLLSATVQCRKVSNILPGIDGDETQIVKVEATGPLPPSGPREGEEISVDVDVCVFRVRAIVCIQEGNNLSSNIL